MGFGPDNVDFGAKGLLTVRYFRILVEALLAQAANGEQVVDALE